MRLVLGKSINPYFNLAMEEYFLKNKEEDYFMLWRNDKAVIIGKNQNAYAEINKSFVSENDIKLVRRMTGGGAVFHDLGNVNYTFIKRKSPDAFNDYAYFSKVIISYLLEHNVSASLSGRNDMLIEGKKFSGNAQCAYKESVMHHGTLLFSSDKSDISAALNVNPLKIQSKGISSVRSRVTNIREHLTEDKSVVTFMNELGLFVSEYYNAKPYELNEEDIKEINRLVETKYALDSWNYGFKQKFTIKNEKKFSFGIVQIHLFIENNLIKDLKIYGDYFGERDVLELERVLSNSKYLESESWKLLEDIDIDSYIKGMSLKEFLELMYIS